MSRCRKNGNEDQVWLLHVHGMPFGLCNVLSTFTTFMNSIFHEKLNDFVIIYIDDILVYSKVMEEHVAHLKYVLNKFRENQFFANRANIEFS
jgi:hypothetical protein